MDRRKKGSGQITRVEGRKSPWRASVLDSSGKQKSRFFKTEKEAKAFLREINADANKLKTLMETGVSFRAFAEIVKGNKKAENVTAWIVPGSWGVFRQIEEEGLAAIFTEAGFELREPGCSACLAMNEDKIPAGKYAVSTSNRNFEGRQGPGARTILASPYVAAAAAITGKITDPRKFL